MIPVMREKGAKAVSIPEMSGGVNLRDGIRFIKDNQLSDCENLWHRDSLLCTRPAVVADNSVERVIRHTRYGQSALAYAGVRIHSDITMSSEGKLYVLQIVVNRGAYSSTEAVEGVIRSTFTFRWVNTASPTDVEAAGEWVKVGTAENPPSVHYVCYEHEGVVYFLSNYTVVKLENEQLYEIDPKEIDNGIYIPTVMTNGLPSTKGGDMINAYNAIGSYYKAEYSLTEPDNAGTGEYPIVAEFHLPVKMNDIDSTFAHSLEGYSVRAEITTKEYGKVVHEVTLTNPEKNWIIGREAEHNDDKLMMTVTLHQGLVSFSAVEEETFTFLQNNVVITAPRKSIEALTQEGQDEYDIVFGMQRATWFGGSAEGIYGGSRVFLCGNVHDRYHSLICWSHRDTPTYFPVTCQSYVGATDQQVTAFGKQGNALIIFKEGEVYASTYLQGTTPTVEEIQNQEVIDLTSSSAVFPLTLINPTIGCDCPDTVQLCRNRLVWAHSTGQVYTLVNSANTTERSIYTVGEMVEAKLRGRSGELKTGHAVDHEGHYMLFCGRDVLVMNYNSYGYSCAYSYQKTEDANSSVPWWVWRLPGKPVASASLGEVLLLPGVEAYYEVSHGVVSYVYMGYTDTASAEDYAVAIDTDSYQLVGRSIPIHCRAVSKAFDFGAPALGKNVTGVHITFGYNGGNAVTVRFVSNNSRPDERRVEIVLPEAFSLRTAIRYLKTLLLHPRARAVQAMAVELECDGNMVIGPVSLVYEMLGAVK